jgi:hypothetical protein
MASYGKAGITRINGGSSELIVGSAPFGVFEFSG